MQTIVTMSKNEWEELPGKIANAIHSYSLKEFGFKVVSKDTGKEITERLDNWWVGVVGVAFHEAGLAPNHQVGVQTTKNAFYSVCPIELHGGL